MSPDPAPTKPAKVPTAAAWLGALGALPFVALAIARYGVAGHASAFYHDALAAYGAVILSFLGGAQWGLAIGGAARASGDKLAGRLVVSVIPSLVGWAALLVEERAGLLLLAVAFAAMLWVDLRAARQGRAPAWYPRLRVPLTVVVIASLLLGASA